MFLSQIMDSKNVAATLQYVKLTPNALPPTRGSSMAAGIDLKMLTTSRFQPLERDLWKLIWQYWYLQDVR